MSTNAPILPQELLDLIVDDFFRIPDDVERKDILLKLTLVSRPFRDRVHDHLFASVAITEYGVDACQRTASRLCSIFEANPFTETRGLASRITSFSCVFGPQDLKPLATILRKIFNDESYGGTRRTPCSLSLTKYSTNVDFPILNKDFALALYEVCHRSRLASLSLQHFGAFPRNIRGNTSISHLILDHTCLRETLPGDVLDKRSKTRFSSHFLTNRGQAAVFESVLHLEVRLPSFRSDTWPPKVTQLVERPPQRSIAFFSQLKILSFHIIPWDEGMWKALEEIMIDSSSSLEELSIAIHSDLTPNISSLPLHKLPKLRKFTADERNGGNNFFRSVAIMLGEEEYCSTLQTIELSLTIYLECTTVCLESMAGYFSMLSCDVLDGLFQHPRFDNIRSITLRPTISVSYSTHHYESDDYEGHIRSHFPSLASRRNLDFSVSIAEWTTWV